jgi:hypothetical protein
MEAGSDVWHSIGQFVDLDSPSEVLTYISVHSTFLSHLRRRLVLWLFGLENTHRG